jgi:hypothetical protein
MAVTLYVRRLGRLLVSAIPIRDVLSASEESVVQPMEPGKVTLTGSRTTIDATKVVVKYRIQTICKGENGEHENSIVERRYKEFENLNEILRSMFASSHLVSSFPALPGRSYDWCNSNSLNLGYATGKCLNPFVDQRSVGFLDHRQQALQLYIQGLVGISKLCSNPDLLLFLGLHPTTGRPLGNEIAGIFDEDDDVGAAAARDSKEDEA